MTYKRLLELLSPQFGEEGSNRRSCEEHVYRLFVKYVKEAAGKLAKERNVTGTG